MTLIKTIALLDANVLYPAPVRDILLNFADAKLFQPKWTKMIQEEWTSNLLAATCSKSEVSNLLFTI